MAVDRQSVVYDIYDVKLYPLLTDEVGASPTYGPAVDVPGIAELSLDPNLVTGELKGDGGKVIAKKGRLDRMNGSITYGKVALAVLEASIGGAVTDPSAGEARWVLEGDQRLPYFKLEGKSEDVEEGLGDLHVVLPKCQITGGTFLQGATETFTQPTMTFEAFAPDGTNELIVVKFLANVTELSA